MFYNAIDSDKNGSVSKLEMIDAVYRDPQIADFVLQASGGAASSPQSDEQRFDAVDAIFDCMAGGRPRINFDDFAAYFEDLQSEKAWVVQEMRNVYSLIDADGNGAISKLELVSAAQRDPAVAKFLVPGLDCRKIMRDEDAFDAISALFDGIACGKRRIEYADFERYYRKTVNRAPRSTAHTGYAPPDRVGKRVLVLGPGFGTDVNTQQAQAIQNAGFDVQWCWDLPDITAPLQHGSRAAAERARHLASAIAAAEPNVIVAASSGGAYMVELWAHGLWSGPTVMINAHPSLQRLPAHVSVVLAHGANDELYKRTRAELEAIMETGSPNKCLFYYTGNSGEISPGAYTRLGDRHQMHSLTLHDCLPRLVDAALAGAAVGEACGGPEGHFVRSWRGRLSEQRLQAERWLGYTTERLRSRWASPGHRGTADRRLFEVAAGSEEFVNVATIFRACPREPSDYELGPPSAWERAATVVRVERVENGPQEAGSARPYADALRKAFQVQGLSFEPGVHTCWAWHGTCAGTAVLESIVSDPVAGFQPLTTGLRNRPLWGPGAYFARDAQYVAEGKFCGPVAPDGTRQMLLCLLSLGMPCLGDPEHRGVLPFRRKPHRYHSSVDSLSSPEIFALQHPGAAHPAYVVTFL